MRAVVQRVKRAEVCVCGSSVGSCRKGFLILLGVEKGDAEEDALLLAAKLSKLRIFEDEQGKMNLALRDVGGELLVVSNFTLCADCRHGNRPDYFRAEEPGKAKVLYEFFTDRIREMAGCRTETGVFGADMEISLINDGPVTVILASEELKKRKDNL